MKMNKFNAENLVRGVHCDNIPISLRMQSGKHDKKVPTMNLIVLQPLIATILLASCC